jgi:hypothetical protein
MDNASILSRRDVRPLPKPARKEVSPAPGTKTGKPILNRCACLLGNFELNRPTCFLLNHRRSVSHPAADTHVIGSLAVVIAGALLLLLPDDQLLGWVPFAPRLTDWLDRLQARPIVGSFDTTEAVPVADLVAFRWIVLGLFAAGLTALRARRG